MNKRTPGPWYLIADSGCDFTAISTKKTIDRDIDIDTEVLGSSEWIRAKPEDLKLMAAAPDLLNALTKLFEIGQVFPGAIELNVTPYDFSVDFEMWEKEARLAIAKATGEEPQATS